MQDKRFTLCVATEDQKSSLASSNLPETCDIVTWADLAAYDAAHPKEAREMKYRSGYRDGFVAALNAYFDLMRQEHKSKGSAYDVLFDFWEDDLLDWLHQQPRDKPVWPPSVHVGHALRLEDGVTTREALFAAHKGVCGICGEAITNRKWHIDHIVPSSRGGRTVWANLQPAHANCNMAKSNRLPNEALSVPVPRRRRRLA